MASDLFLRIDGINGDSQVAGHEMEMELLGWSVSASVPVGPRTAGGSGAAGTSIHGELSITKQIDEASNKLSEACWKGTTIPQAVVTVQRQGDKAGMKVDYLKLTLTDVIVSSVSTSGGPGEVPVENLTLNYATIKREYFTTDVSGSGSGWQSTGWNVAKEEAL